MKFDWGTGILIFLILFLAAAAIFIGFAMRQDVSLVHEDYYERGVTHTEQMKVDARSAVYTDSLKIYFENESMVVEFKGMPEMKVDSGRVFLYRPSGSTMDMNIPFDFSSGTLTIPGSDIYRGRYILKLSWYAEGLKYEIDRAVSVP